jgi:hypothetical protein
MQEMSTGASPSLLMEQLNQDSAYPVQYRSLALSAGYYPPQFQVLAIPVDFNAECGHQGCDRTEFRKECIREKS